MIVMPANSTGWFWHSLARETGRIGHLYSPGAQRGPWPWFPYALDNGAYSCWDRDSKTFDDAKWARTESKWHMLIVWAQAANLKPRWAVVPDVPGNAERTLGAWERFAAHVRTIPRALAVQDGMTPADVRSLKLQPDVIAVGGSTADNGRAGWKWDTLETWARSFPRVHVLRCNAPDRLIELEALGIESCDGTGWNRGDLTQTAGLERWARERAEPTVVEAWRFLRQRGRPGRRQPQQEAFA